MHVALRDVHVMTVHLVVAVPALRAGEWEAYHCAWSQQVISEHHVFLQGHGSLHGEQLDLPDLSYLYR